MRNTIYIFNEYIFKEALNLQKQLNTVLIKLKSLRSHILVFVFAVALSAKLSAQIPSNPIGNNGVGLKWNQIETDKVKLIYPRGLDRQANRIVNLVHHLWEVDSPSIGNNHKKAPIVLHPQNSLSNGLVTVAPFRSEFFARAPQFDGTTDWLDHLTIHEYQHIKQFNQSRQGITGLVRNVLGDWAWGGMMALAIPRWYFEGDATIAETVFTKSGRGRIPEFTMEYKSLLKDGVRYSYEKAGARSMKDFVPDWWSLGYHLLTYGRKEFGPDLWKNVTADAVRYKGIIYPFNKSVKKRTGYPLKELYAKTMDDLQEQWSAQEKRMADDPSSFVFASDNRQTVLHRSTPQFDAKGNLCYIKSGFDRIASLEELSPSGKVNRLTRPGILLERQLEQLSASNNKMVWAELGWDIRRQFKRFSEIVIFDKGTKKKTRLTKNNFDYSPALNADATKIAAIRTNEELLPQVIILDSANGEITQTLPNKQKYQLSYMQWLDADHVILVAKANQQNAIFKVSLLSSELTRLTDWTSDAITHLAVHDQQIYFSKPTRDINQIFMIDVKTKMKYQITKDNIAAFQPAISPDGKTLVYSSFSHRGYELKKLDLDANNAFRKERKTIDENYRTPFVAAIMKQEKDNLLAEVGDEEFESKPYNRFSGLVKPHSILTNFDQNFVEFSLLSDNVFSTLSADATASYRFNEDAWRYSVGLTYAELFPELSLRFERVGRGAVLFNFSELGQEGQIQQNRVLEFWRENRIRAGIAVPLNFSSGQTSRTMSLIARYTRHHLDVDGNLDNDDFVARDTLDFSQGNFPQNLLEQQPLGDEQFSSVDLIWIGRIQQFTALQNLGPRFGASGFARWRKAFGSIDDDVIQLDGTLFLPGLSRNHSFSIEYAYQAEGLLDRYRFSDNFNYPRGYNRSLRADRFHKIGFNYRFPIWYPDVAIGGLAFIKRFKGNVFYDHGSINIASEPFQPTTTSLRSVGFELGVDFRAARLLEIDLGVRYSYLFDEQFSFGRQHQFDFFVISISE